MVKICECLEINEPIIDQAVDSGACTVSQVFDRIGIDIFPCGECRKDFVAIIEEKIQKNLLT